MNIFPIAGIVLGLVLGLVVSRGAGIALLALLGAALGWLLSLTARR